MGFSQRWYIKQKLDKVGVKFEGLNINYYYLKLFQMAFNTFGDAGFEAVAQEVASGLSNHPRQFPGKAYVNVHGGNFSTLATVSVCNVFVILVLSLSLIHLTDRRVGSVHRCMHCRAYSKVRRHTEEETRYSARSYCSCR